MSYSTSVVYVITGFQGWDRKIDVYKMAVVHMLIKVGLGQMVGGCLPEATPKKGRVQSNS